MNNIRELLSIRDMIRYAVTLFNKSEIFFGHGSDNAWDEAVYLILHTLNLDPDILDPFLDAKILQEEKINILNILKERIEKRIPSSYLTKEAWLKGYRFYVDQRVIIPRSFLAEVICENHDIFYENGEIREILDMCTGSGCLAIIAACNFKDSHIDAIDISNEALLVAEKNINQYKLNKRINIYQSDLFNNIDNRQYDLIICNPPYVSENSINSLPKEYLYEPKIALYGGIYGMDYIEKIIGQAKNYLTKKGVLLIEIGNEYENFIKVFKNLKPKWINNDNSYKQVFMLHYDQL